MKTPESLIAEPASPHAATSSASSGAVLVIVEDLARRATLAEGLRQAGLDVFTAPAGEEGLRRAQAMQPALVVADDSLPEAEALAVCRQVRHGQALMLLVPKRFPVLSGGLVSEPDHDLRLLADGVATLVRGAPPAASGESMVFHGLRMDRQRMSVWVDEQLVQFTPTEFRILWALTEQPGFVLTREQLLVACRESNAPGRGRTVDAHVRTMRRKLRTHGDLIETVRGVGYRLNERHWADAAK